MYFYKNYFESRISINEINGKWEVEYESYFNPHTIPNQLIDKKEFASEFEAIKWVENYIDENYK